MEYLSNLPELIDYKNPRDLLIEKDIEIGVEEILDTLSYREKQILKLIFFERKTLVQCSKILKVSSGRIRQIRDRALSKIKHTSRYLKIKQLFGINMKQILYLHIPTKTVSEANISEHWSKKNKRHKLQKNDVFFALLGHRSKIKFPCEILLKRLGKKLLDSDNLSFSLKWVRDAVADSIIPGLPPGKADGDPRIKWDYAQEVSKDYGVIIEIYQ